MRIIIKNRDFFNMSIVFLFLTVLWGAGSICESRIILWSGIVFADIVIIFYSVRKLSVRVGLLFFMITMFMLNIGYFFIEAFRNGNYTNNWLINFIPSWKQEVITSFLMLLALMFSFFGQWSSENIIRGRKVLIYGETVSNVRMKFNMKLLSKAALIIYYIGLICFTIESIEQIAFVQTFSYNEKYIVNLRKLPSIIYRLENLMWPGFFVFCTCMPTKKKFRIPAIILIGISVLSLLGGSRGGFVLNILIILFYIIFRQQFFNHNETWMGKKHWMILFFMMPIGIFILVGIQFWRTGGQMTMNLFEALEVLAGNGSGVLIMDELQYHDALPKQNYVFGAAINYLQNNIWGGLTGTRISAGQTREYALYGNNFAASMTYLLAPRSYLSGGGFGTAYLAEAYHNLSYFGVVVISYIYGVILGESTLSLRKNYGLHPFRSAFILLMIQAVLYAPRSIAIGFITDSVLSFWNWASFALIYFFYLLLRKHQRKL